MTLLSVQGLGKHFGAKTVLDGLDFAVERGQVYGLLGPNGCGKSTAINLVCGLLAPDAGLVRVEGVTVSRQTQRQVGLCPQDSALYGDLRPAENLDFHARLHGLATAARRRRVDELMQMFGLAPFAGTPVARLSGGWRQRVNLAVALVHAPALLVLDEPTAAVDVEARHELWDLIEGLQAQGTTLLLTTHNLEEAERLCSCVGLLRGGRIAAEGSVAELRAHVPAQAVALVQAADEAAVRARAAQHGWATRVYGGRLACLLPQQLSLGAVVSAFDGLDVVSVSVLPVALEHAYLEVMRAGDAAHDR